MGLPWKWGRGRGGSGLTVARRVAGLCCGCWLRGEAWCGAGTSVCQAQRRRLHEGGEEGRHCGASPPASPRSTTSPRSSHLARRRRRPFPVISHAVLPRSRFTFRSSSSLTETKDLIWACFVCVLDFTLNSRGQQTISVYKIYMY